MRIPSFSNIVRTFYTLTNATTRALPASQRALRPFTRGTVLKSMPTIPSLGSLFSRSNSQNMSYPMQKSDDEWQAVLNKGTPTFSNLHYCGLIPSLEQFRVLREKGTEAPFTGQYDKHMPSSGVYTCGGCNAPLYKANHKFKSGCGWPAYFDSIPGAVTRHTDRTFGMSRTEIVCSKCGGHLGHIFKGEGYPTPTDERHCVNSVSLNFSKDDPVVSGKSEAKV